MRCFGDGNPLLENYHDHEWGMIVVNDQKLFEWLILEGAQAGLNFLTILKKRDAYRAQFFNFDIKKVAFMSDNELAKTLLNKSIIRNKLKVFATRRNALVCLKIQNEYNSLANFLWKYVNYQPIQSYLISSKNAVTTSPLSVEISKELKRKGMNFVGPTIIYSYMEAIGMINNHLVSCKEHSKCLNQNQTALLNLKNNY